MLRQKHSECDAALADCASYQKIYYFLTMLLCDRSRAVRLPCPMQLASLPWMTASASSPNYRTMHYYVSVNMDNNLKRCAGC
jgi:hypothetical protein